MSILEIFLEHQDFAVRLSEPALYVSISVTIFSHAETKLKADKPNLAHNFLITTFHLLALIDFACLWILTSRAGGATGSDRCAKWRQGYEGFKLQHKCLLELGYLTCEDRSEGAIRKQRCFQWSCSHDRSYSPHS